MAGIDTYSGINPYAPYVWTQEHLENALAGGARDIYVYGREVIPITGTITIAAPARIVGGWFSTAAHSGDLFHITSSDVEMTGVRIDGPGLAAGVYDSVDSQKLIFAEGTEAAPISRIRINNCVLNGSLGNNVWLQWCRASSVMDNTITDFLYSGIMFISGNGVKAEGNHVENAPDTPEVANTYGIAFTDLDNTESARCRNFTCVGNHVELIDWEGIDSHGGIGGVITGNTVLACPRGIALVVGNETRIAAPQDIVVSGNRVDGTGYRVTPAGGTQGIFVGGIANTPADAQVTGNIVLGHSPAFFTNFVDRDKIYIGGNNVPYLDWTDIPLNAGEFTANATYTPQYKIDGNTVYLRGAVIPASGGLASHGAIATLPNAFAWPSTLSVVGHIRAGKGLDEGVDQGVENNGQLVVWEDGRLAILYGIGTDQWSFYLSGTYQAK